MLAPVGKIKTQIRVAALVIDGNLLTKTDWLAGSPAVPWNLHVDCNAGAGR